MAQLRTEQWHSEAVLGARSPNPGAAVSRVCRAPYPQLRQRQDLALRNPRGAGVLPLLLRQQLTEPLVGTLRGKKKSGSVVRAGWPQPVRHRQHPRARWPHPSAPASSAGPGSHSRSRGQAEEPLWLLPTPARGLPTGSGRPQPLPRWAGRHRQHPRTFARPQPAPRERHRHLPAQLAVSAEREPRGRAAALRAPRQRLNPAGPGWHGGALTVLTARSPACSRTSAPAGIARVGTGTGAKA